MNSYFCSTLSEFENFLLYELILINAELVKTKRQVNFKDFKRFGGFKGLVEQKNVVFNSFLCKLGFFWHEWVKQITILTLEEHTKLNHHHSFLRTFLLFFFKMN
jgi:hypothetical protein